MQNAQLLYFSNLSHSGVPVHPLQFQRQVRKLGVDPDCHVVLYDRGQLIWSAYAFWIFKVGLRPAEHLFSCSGTSACRW